MQHTKFAVFSTLVTTKHMPCIPTLVTTKCSVIEDNDKNWALGPLYYIGNLYKIGLEYASTTPWCPGSWRCKLISNHDTDYVIKVGAFNLRMNLTSFMGQNFDKLFKMQNRICPSSMMNNSACIGLILTMLIPRCHYNGGDCVNLGQINCPPWLFLPSTDHRVSEIIQHTIYPSGGIIIISTGLM